MAKGKMKTVYGIYKKHGREAFLDAAEYGIVNNMLNVDYEAFLPDIQMGQYIEVANQFTPPKRIGTQIFRDTSMYNEKTERALDGLSRKIIGK